MQHFFSTFEGDSLFPMSTYTQYLKSLKGALKWLEVESVMCD